MQIMMSILITIIAYSVFPLLFAYFRQSSITSKRYRIYSFLFNFVLHVLLVTIGIFSNSATIAPMLIWTFVATYIGKKILESHGTLTD